MPETPGTAITMTIDGHVSTATLHDNPAANALVEQLPLTLTFDDFNAVEKTARLPSPLSMEGMPEGDDPEVGEIGFWAPGGDLVLYHGDVGYWNGIARLGTFDDVDAIANRTEPFTVTIAIQ
ncbi:cyclophilin-like fold protein [Microbacterium paludicola]|uniref:cyclophilin-like fold protein n=1 Tax=Microbacterium paludicola TaxID=300019 RepID=UPI00119D6492|nr:cyclophilin-like fold protein [Microbacterium paludicola]